MSGPPVSLTGWAKGPPLPPPLTTTPGDEQRDPAIWDFVGSSGCRGRLGGFWKGQDSRFPESVASTLAVPTPPPTAPGPGSLSNQAAVTTLWVCELSAPLPPPTSVGDKTWEKRGQTTVPAPAQKAPARGCAPRRPSYGIPTPGFSPQDASAAQCPLRSRPRPQP